MHHMGTGFQWRRHIVIVVWLLVLSSLSVPARASSYDIEISKSERLLLVRQNDEVIRQYHIAYGKGGTGKKTRLGDKKTPVGIYRITEFKSDSRFHFFMLLDYPNLLDAWRGYKNEVISAFQFKEIATAYRDRALPPQDTALGGYIGIHGIGETTPKQLEVHELFNWTEGCIALTNEEINELLQYVTIGTQVTIRE